MRLDWKIKPSKISSAAIILLSITSVLISISIEQSYELTAIVIVLCSVMFLFLKKITQHTSKPSTKHLAWEDGQWFFFNKDMFITGVQSKYSFSLGLFMFLSIEPKDGQRIVLWLFSDNILSSSVNTKKQLAESNQLGWHHLHCCFHLSSELHQDV